ncbi:uncharacterized protein FN964_007544 [Alca torda]
MSAGRHRWSLGSLLLPLGGSLAVLVQIHQDSLNGTVGQSVLLPVSYTFDAATRFPLSIFWRFRNSSDTVITCAVSNCSLGPGGAPRNCSATCFPKPTYHRRAELFPENGSLLLRHLKLSDSGVYSVTFGSPSQTRHISLTVHEQRFPPECPDPSNTEEPEHVYYWAIGICSSVALLLLFLLFHCLRHRGAAQQKKRRINQQQVSSVEEPHLGSTAARDVATIYARVGDRFEQPQPRPPSEVVYTSITDPRPPAGDTGLYHLLV